MLDLSDPGHQQFVAITQVHRVGIGVGLWKELSLKSKESSLGKVVADLDSCQASIQ